MNDLPLSVQAQSVVDELRTTIYKQTAESALRDRAGANEAIASGLVCVVCVKETTYNPGGERFLAAA